MKWLGPICLAFWPGVVGALELALPEGARLTAERDVVDGGYDLPIAPFDGQNVPAMRIVGHVRFEVWRVETGFTGVAALADALRALLEKAAFRIELDCETDGCGGFDYRFNTQILPPPDMFVDLSDFHVLSAVREGPAGREGVNLLVSGAVRAGLVHVVHVVEGQTADPVTLVVPEAPDQVTAPVASTIAGAGAEDSNAIARALEIDGHVALPGLSFETGSSRLSEGDVPVLLALAAYLAENPEAQVTLVGHTDSEGGLEKNMTLSKRRAEAVREYLIDELGVEATQLAAAGVGYLAPVATNATPEGRDRNRRVEAVLTSAN